MKLLLFVAAAATLHLASADFQESLAELKKAGDDLIAYRPDSEWVRNSVETVISEIGKLRGWITTPPSMSRIYISNILYKEGDAETPFDKFFQAYINEILSTDCSNNKVSINCILKPVVGHVGVYLSGGWFIILGQIAEWLEPYKNSKAVKQIFG